MSDYIRYEFISPGSQYDVLADLELCNCHEEYRKNNHLNPVNDTGLDAAGVANHLVYYPGEGHGWTGANMVDSFRKIVAFISDHARWQGLTRQATYFL